MALTFPLSSLFEKIWRWGTGPDVGNIRTVPVNSASATAASFENGFPILTATPIALGGIPPAQDDFNGILQQITANQQWVNAGGQWHYSSALATAIGGYPQGAILQLDDNVTSVIATSANVMTDPNSDMTGWAVNSPSFGPPKFNSALAATAGYPKGAIIKLDDELTYVINNKSTTLVTDPNLGLSWASNPGWRYLSSAAYKHKTYGPGLLNQFFAPDNTPPYFQDYPVTLGCKNYIIPISSGKILAIGEIPKVIIRPLSHPDTQLLLYLICGTGTAPDAGTLLSDLTDLVSPGFYRNYNFAHTFTEESGPILIGPTIIEGMISGLSLEMEYWVDVAISVQSSNEPGGKYADFPETILKVLEV